MISGSGTLYDKDRLLQMVKQKTDCSSTMLPLSGIDIYVLLCDNLKSTE